MRSKKKKYLNPSALLLTVSEVALMLDVSAAAARYWIKTGRIKHMNDLENSNLSTIKE